MSIESLRDAAESTDPDLTLVPPRTLLALCDLADALEDALGALEAHRADMHERSSRPCSTCARSERALEQGHAALARLDGEDTG